MKTLTFSSVLIIFTIISIISINPAFAGGEVEDIASETASEVEDIASETASEVEDIASETASEVEDIASETASEVEDIASETASEVEDIASETASEVEDIASETASEVEDIASETASEVEDIASETASEVEDIASETASEVEDIASETASEVEDIASETASEVEDIASETASEVEDIASETASEVEDIASETASEVEDIASETASEVEDIEIMTDERSEININVGDDTDNGGGCLIATASYGTELAPQVQLLREIRDNTVMSTSTGASFMTGFNQLYYSFSPTIADLERENPMFQETVRAFITPMISTLSIMTLAENGNEAEVLGLGISVIALNLGMYIAAPALVGFTVSKRLRK